MNTGNAWLNFLLIVIAIVVGLIVLFRVLDILDDEADRDGAYVAPIVREL